MSASTTSRRTFRRHGQPPTPDSHSFPTRPYDLVKEFVIALLAVALLTTATGELAGTPTSAGYDPPYNTAADGQVLGPRFPR